MNTYIFLDVDGVLNDERYCIKMHEKYGGRFFMYEMPFNPKSLKNLSKIVNKTKADIVLSSSWRIDEDGMIVLKARLKEYGLIIDDKLPKYIENRGKSIRQWLTDNADIYNTIVLIIDDETRDIEKEFEYVEIIQTDPFKGLTRSKATEAIDKYYMQKQIIEKEEIANGRICT